LMVCAAARPLSESTANVIAARLKIFLLNIPFFFSSGLRTVTLGPIDGTTPCGVILAGVPRLLE